MRKVPGAGEEKVAGWLVAVAFGICLWIIILKLFGAI
jgi:hypothetical protein